MNIIEAIKSGKPIRNPDMPQSVSYKVFPNNHKNGSLIVHIIGPDDYVPFGEAINYDWLLRDDWGVVDEER